MRLYVLPAASYYNVMTTYPNSIVIGQAPDCSSWLILAEEQYDGLETFDGNYGNYDFIYCQEWGLTINDEVVVRAWADQRRKSYPPMADYLDAIVKDDENQKLAYIQACLDVKNRYTKVILT